jgi:hypothetical protein
MSARSLGPRLFGSLMVTGFLMCSSLHAQDKVLKAGGSVDLATVFWASGCTSTLITVTGVELISGPPGVQLSVRGEDVVPRQQDCPKVPGGVIVATVKDVATPVSGTIRYRVRYKTADGPRQSEHSIGVSLQP